VHHVQGGAEDDRPLIFWDLPQDEEEGEGSGDDHLDMVMVMMVMIVMTVRRMRVTRA
jgi:hypothetical protein